jgi:crossover junction endodeoxyribonuclease RuvC
VTSVVGIDPSLTAAGIAVIASPQTSDTPNVPKLVCVGAGGSKSASLLQRATRIEAQKVAILRSLPEKVALVVIEDLPTHMPARGALSERIGLWWALTGFLAARKIPVVAVHPSTLKSFATGNGKAEKPEMVAAARDLWPHAQVRNDNEADALLLASAGAMHLRWHQPELPCHYAPRIDWTGVTR